MLDTQVPKGALYYGKNKRRVEIAFDDFLRQTTLCTAQKLHDLLRLGSTPPPVYTPACESCSFLESCLPETVSKKGKVSKYMETLVKT
jgi:CRISPR-associated exonuclease Cas4